MALTCSFVLLALASGAAGMVVYAALGMLPPRLTFFDFEDVPASSSYALVDCAPSSAAEANSSGFRESVVQLLAALPAAAAPAGFASIQSDDDRAFVRGFCYGLLQEKPCRACLADSCLGASRRAGAWRSEGCFLAYADADTPSAREDAFRKVLLGGEDPGEDPSSNCFDPRRLVALARSMGRRDDVKFIGARVTTDAAALATASRVFPDVAKSKVTVRVQAQCPWDITAAECARCLGESARRVPPCSWGIDGAR